MDYLRRLGKPFALWPHVTVLVLSLMPLAVTFGVAAMRLLR